MSQEQGFSSQAAFSSDLVGGVKYKMRKHRKVTGLAQDPSAEQASKRLQGFDHPKETSDPTSGNLGK